VRVHAPGPVYHVSTAAKKSYGNKVHWHKEGKIAQA